MYRHGIRDTSQELISSISDNNTNAVASLLSEGINVNARDSDEIGMVALHHAVFAEDISILYMLLEHGAYPDDATYGGIRPVDTAFALCKAECIEALVSYSARVDVKLFELCQSNEPPQHIVDLFYAHVDLRDRDHYGYSALHKAVKCGDIRGVEMLLERGASVDERTLNDGLTPMHIAARNGNVPCMDLLIRRGSRLNLRDEFGLTPLHMLMIAPMALELDKAQAMMALMDAGADINLTCNRGRTVLHCALTAKSVRLLTTILKRMAILRHNELPVSEINMNLVQRVNRLRNYYNQCIRELDLIKEQTVCGTVRLYDFLLKNSDQLARYTRNPEVLESFVEKKYRIRFPNFYDNLRRNFYLALKRRQLLDGASFGLSTAMQYFDPSNIIVQKILGFLNVDDLKNLAGVLMPEVQLNL